MPNSQASAYLGPNRPRHLPSKVDAFTLRISMSDAWRNKNENIFRYLRNSEQQKNCVFENILNITKFSGILINDQFKNV
jgi:hypothetical protein